MKMACSYVFYLFHEKKNVCQKYLEIKIQTIKRLFDMGIIIWRMV